MNSDADKDFLDEIRHDARESEILFSSRGTKELEKRAVRGFLRTLGIPFPEDELQFGQAEPVDVCFRDARFQITERLDSGRRRNLEWRQIADRRRQATRLEQLLEPYTPSRPMLPNEVAVLVVEEVTRKWKKYRNGCTELDVLVYVNLQDRHLPPESLWPDLPVFRKQGWRSVSLLMDRTGVVLFASETAPEFLRSVVRQTRREWDKPDGLFDP